MYNRTLRIEARQMVNYGCALFGAASLIGLPVPLLSLVVSGGQLKGHHLRAKRFRSCFGERASSCLDET